MTDNLEHQIFKLEKKIERAKKSGNLDGVWEMELDLGLLQIEKEIKEKGHTNGTGQGWD